MPDPDDDTVPAPSTDAHAPSEPGYDDDITPMVLLLLDG
jgi:hypothetical protein